MAALAVTSSMVSLGTPTSLNEPVTSTVDDPAIPRDIGFQRHGDRPRHPATTSRDNPLTWETDAFSEIRGRPCALSDEATPGVGYGPSVLWRRFGYGLFSGVLPLL